MVHEKLDLIVKAGGLKDRAVVLDLKDHERALVWIENRFSHVLSAGLFAYWTGQKSVRVEVIDSRNVRLQHDELNVIARSPFVVPPSGGICPEYCADFRLKAGLQTKVNTHA